MIRQSKLRRYLYISAFRWIVRNLCNRKIHWNYEISMLPKFAKFQQRKMRRFKAGSHLSYKLRKNDRGESCRALVRIASEILFREGEG